MSVVSQQVSCLLHTSLAANSIIHHNIQMDLNCIVDNNVKDSDKKGFVKSRIWDSAALYFD